MTDHADILDLAREKVLERGEGLTREETLQVLQLPDERIEELLALAHEVRLKWCGEEVEVEGIISLKTGGCPEDCHFCSQSGLFESPVRSAWLDIPALVDAAKQTRKTGATEFCIVAAVKGPDERLLEQLEHAVATIRSEVDINVAASVGILTQEQVDRLAKAGVHRYNHNLETARSHFSKVVTTHAWEDRQHTCELVRQHGMELCCGVLLGMGESVDQRLELLNELRAVEPTEVPINFLNPRPGTPLADAPVVGALEAIRWIAMFRLALPSVILRYAGGREITLRELQALGMTSGINALIVGNYLTTLGRTPTDDLQMLEDLHMPIGVLSKVI